MRVLFIYPNIVAGLRQAKGRLFPLGFLHVLAERRRTQWLNLNGIGMLPEYQGKGGPAVIYAELYKSLIDNKQFKYTELVQIAEHNTKSLNETVAFGAEIHKIHDLYFKVIG